MRKTFIARCVLGGFAVFVFASQPCAQEDILTGLPGVMVNIDIEEVLSKDGLSAGLIKTDVVTALEKAKITAFRENEWRSVEGHPQLLVTVNGTKVQDNWKFYTYAVNVYLLQDVLLAQGGATRRHQAATWFISSAGHGYFPDIRSQIKQLVNSFTESYSSANP